MARALRLEYESAIYHVTARGNERKKIFRSDADRKRFLQKLGEMLSVHQIRLYAFVLMSNHYHLLLETPRANLSQFMHQLNTSYTMYFNHKHRRYGHLFGGRYKAKLVEGDEYLLRLTRTIHLNPVKLRLCAHWDLEQKRERLRTYTWSSYPSYGGLQKRLKWLDYGPLEALVDAGQKPRTRGYREYIENDRECLGRE